MKYSFRGAKKCIRGMIFWFFYYVINFFDEKAQIFAFLFIFILIYAIINL
ncbi:hypothetical protein EFM7_0263 [Enterococcus faecalis M7]|nr:hypothetical protein EFM7_0263 [Enterococcus faecalis M7]OSH08418.1 hypothetical protein EFDM72_2351 [Enterococcus faecalis]